MVRENKIHEELVKELVNKLKNELTTERNEESVIPHINTLIQEYNIKIQDNQDRFGLLKTFIDWQLDVPLNQIKYATSRFTVIDSELLKENKDVIKSVILRDDKGHAITVDADLVNPDELLEDLVRSNKLQEHNNDTKVTIDFLNIYYRRVPKLDLVSILDTLLESPDYNKTISEVECNNVYKIKINDLLDVIYYITKLYMGLLNNKENYTIAEIQTVETIYYLASKLFYKDYK